MMLQRGTRKTEEILTAIQNMMLSDGNRLLLIENFSDEESHRKQ